MRASAVKVAALLRRAGGREAQRLAAAILEVLAGARTPQQAAEAVSVSLPRYYQLETRAMIGLVAACEPRVKGRQRTAQSEAAAAKKENDRLRQELTRQQTLVRLAQRTVGLSPAVATKGKRKRKPVVRALAAAARLREEAEKDHDSVEIS
jgi:hypothetical protein